MYFDRHQRVFNKNMYRATTTIDKIMIKNKDAICRFFRLYSTCNVIEEISMYVIRMYVKLILKVKINTETTETRKSPTTTKVKNKYVL